MTGGFIMAQQPGGGGGPPPGQTFDFYIGPSGSNSNPGTVASPWAITALKTDSTRWSLINGVGKRIGLLPGTYDVSSLMLSDKAIGALQFPGGASAGSPNYIGSSDSSGFYSPRTATLDAKGASGLYGGGISTGFGVYAGPIVAHGGFYPVAYVTSNLVVDGLRFTGHSFKAIRFGNGSSGDGPNGLTGIVCQNCEFFGKGNNATDTSDNTTSVWLDDSVGAKIINNYFHDNVGPSGAGNGDHFNDIICWEATDPIIEYNSCINSANIYGKEGIISGTHKNEGATIRYNYIDVTHITSGGCFGIQDFTGASDTCTHTLNIYNNIILTNQFAIGRSTLSDANGMSSPCNIYNNTIVGSSNGGATVQNVIWGTSHAAAVLKVYNNLYTGVTDAGSSYRFLLTNPAAPLVWDYNFIKATGMTWGLRQNADFTTEIANYTTKGAFATGLLGNGGIANAELHSTANDNAGFTGTGILAEMYKLSGGSAAKNAGSTDGTTLGSACDCGAWGNTSVTRIGYAASP